MATLLRDVLVKVMADIEKAMGAKNETEESEEKAEKTAEETVQKPS